MLGVVGTRPEAIKLRPVMHALLRRPWCEPAIVLTGQHDGLAPAFDMLAAEAIDHLGVDPSEQSAGEICETIHDRLCRYLLAPRPDLVLVQGDTSSALAGALAARDCGVPIAHVEAGLRSHDVAQPWPEEINRVRIDAMADLLFAPTEAAAAHIRAERLAGVLHVTGNSGIDALFAARGTVALVREPGGLRTILATCHRRENRGPALAALTQGLLRIVHELPVEIVFLLHTSRHVRAPIEALLQGHSRIRLLDSVGHADMVALMENAWLIVTDSGGLQEEGASLGRPVLVLRDVTERPEAGDCLELVGTDPDRIFAAVQRLLDDPAKYTRMSRPTTAYGDGRASERMADIIHAWFAERDSAPRQARLDTGPRRAISPPGPPATPSGPFV